MEETLNMKQKLVKLLDQLPYIKGIKRDLLNYEKWGQPGHFYNPIPNLDESELYEYAENSSQNLYAGLTLNLENQKKFVESCIELYKELPFPINHQAPFLYHFDNPNYSYSDSIFYYFIIRKFTPKRIIEIGSGYSTCVALDVNRHFFDNQIDITCVEPYPSLLLDLCKENKPKLFDKKIQEINLDLFDTLNANDILFVDSSHVLKTGSDLNHIFFQILPKLKSGVLIHFHDIFNEFKYPKEWIHNFNRGWNELYALKLFLMYNNNFEIIAFNHFLIENDEKWFAEHMPLCLKNRGGSIWIRKH